MKEPFPSREIRVRVPLVIKMNFFNGLALALSLSFYPAGSFAETIHLKDGKTLKGSIEHVYKGIYTIITPNGPETIGRHEISKIEFPKDVKNAQPKALPKTSSSTFLSTMEESDEPYATPLNTFKTWRKAAIEGSLDKMVTCYASFKQRAKKKELKKLSREAWEKMRAATANTEFLPSAPIYMGDRAFMEVAWTLDLKGDTQTLKFILENDEWKLMQ